MNIIARLEYELAYMVEQCQQKSWKIHFDPVEVGCRGFAGQSLGRALAKIGIVGAARVRALKDITNTVLKVSKSHGRNKEDDGGA